MLIFSWWFEFFYSDWVECYLVSNYDVLFFGCVYIWFLCILFEIFEVNVLMGMFDGFWDFLLLELLLFYKGWVYLIDVLYNRVVYFYEFLYCV